MIKKITRFILICSILVMCIPFSCLASGTPSNFYYNTKSFSKAAFNGTFLNKIYYNDTLVWQRKELCELELNETSATLVYPTTEYTFRVTKNTGGELSVSSSDESVATASINGNVITITYVDEGEADITVKSAETEAYAQGEAIFHVVTYRGDNSLAFDTTSNNYCLADDVTFTINQNALGGDLSVSSSDESVATVTLDGNTVHVSFLTQGTVTISITSNENNYYYEKTESIDLTYASGSITVGSTKYTWYDAHTHTNSSGSCYKDAQRDVTKTVNCPGPVSKTGVYAPLNNGYYYYKPGHDNDPNYIYYRSDASCACGWHKETGCFGTPAGDPLGSTAHTKTTTVKETYRVFSCSKHAGAAGYYIK